MIIEGPYEQNSAMAQAIVVVRDYESNLDLAWQVDMSFAEAANSVSLQKNDRSKGVVHADICALEGQGRLGRRSRIFPQYEFEIHGRSNSDRLRADPNYKNARAFQMDLSGDVYKNILNMNRTAFAYLQALGPTWGVREVDFPFKN